MSTVLKDTQRSRRDSTPLYLSQNFPPQSQQKILSQTTLSSSHLKLLDYTVLAATLFEPTVYLVDGLLSNTVQKLVAAGIGYLTFVVLSVAYFIFGRKKETIDRNLQIMITIVLLGTLTTSLLNAYGNEETNLLLFLPIILFKAILFLHYSITLAISVAVMGAITIAGVVLDAMDYKDESIFQFIEGIVFYLLLIPFLLSFHKQRKKVFECVPKQTETQSEEKYFNLLSILDEAVIVVNELGHPVFLNTSFEKMFSLQKDDEPLDSSRDKSKRYVISEFQKISSIKAKDPELQNRIADVLRTDQTTTPRVSDSISRRVLRYEESPDSLFISDRESSLSTLYLTFLNSEKTLKNNNIGFDTQARLPKFEKFSAVMKKSLRDSFEVDLNLAYIELGGKTYLCVVFHFNSYQHELKEAVREAEFRKQMLRYVAHDMRNPLGSNQLLLEAIESDSSVPSDVKEIYTRPCLKSLKYLLSLVNDLVDAAQLAAGKFKLVISEIFINDVLEDVIKIFEIKAKSKDINLVKIVDPRLPLTVFTDPARLTQVLINLVSNALKYSPRKGVITIKVDPNILNSNKIDFSVEDTGLGIRIEDQKDLLKDFGKVEGSKDPELNPYGVGLGLSISHKLAIQLNVEGAQEGIKIDSILGRGTKMKFSIENRKNENKVESNINTARIQLGMLHLQKKLSENYSASIDENPVLSPCYAQSLSNSVGLEAQRAKKTLSLLRKINDQDVMSRSHQIYGRAFIIDDDAFSAESLATLLRSLGIATDKAYSTKEALRKLEGLADSGSGNGLLYGYDLIFMDGLMDEMDGFESTALLKEKMRNGEVKEAPIVFCTGLGEESEPEAREAGASFYITKPIAKAGLTAILKQVNIGTEMQSS